MKKENLKKVLENIQKRDKWVSDLYSLNMNYAFQDKPNGIAECFIIGEEYIGKDDVVLILGDNLYFLNKITTSYINKILYNNINRNYSTIISIKNNNPNLYGVLSRKEDNISIIEKPKDFISNEIITGLYCYPNDVVNFAKTLKPSSRGELEITDVNNHFINEKRMSVINVSDCSKESKWLDCGSFESYFLAQEKVKCLREKGDNFGIIESII
jgi:glucose-1-phosphate thymidylyltransferase